MRDGQIIDGRIWFGFDLQELQWLRDLVPSGDEFRDEVDAAIGRLAGNDALPTDGE